MHGRNSAQFLVDLGNECAEMKLFGKLAGVEISDRCGADLARIELGIIKGFATGFLDHVAQCLAFFFEIPLKVGSARAEDVNWFIHSCVNLSYAHRAVILDPTSG